MKITPTKLNQILAVNGGISALPNESNSATDFYIWNLPNGPNGHPKLGGMQIDKAKARLYVSDQNNGSGMWFRSADWHFSTVL